jgi:hypothetical protein
MERPQNQIGAIKKLRGLRAAAVFLLAVGRRGWNPPL